MHQMENWLKTFWGLVCVGAFTLAVSGCNTVDGAGEDLQEASENTRDAINDMGD